MSEVSHTQQNASFHNFDGYAQFKDILDVRDEGHKVRKFLTNLFTAKGKLDWFQSQFKEFGLHTQIKGSEDINENKNKLTNKTACNFDRYRHRCMLWLCPTQLNAGGTTEAVVWGFGTHICQSDVTKQ